MNVARAVRRDATGVPIASASSMARAIAHLADAGVPPRVTATTLGISEALGHHVRQSLGALELVDSRGAPTVELRRLARGELQLADVLARRYPELVQAIRSSRSASEIDAAFDALVSGPSRQRFRTLVVKTVGAPERKPRRREPPVPVDLAASLIEREAELYLNALSGALRSDDRERSVYLSDQLARLREELRDVR